MTRSDAVYLPVLAVVIVGIYFLHRPHTRLFWAGLACFLGWAGWLALMPKGVGALSWWMAVDAPLNLGWITLWCWPLFVERLRWSRDMRRALAQARQPRGG